MAVKVDTRQLDRKIAATLAATVAARGRGGLALGAVFVETVDDLTPKDTNRLSNGWLEAGLEAGVSDRPMRPIVPSKDQDHYLAKLEEQVDFWAGQVQYARARMRQYERADASAMPRRDGKPRAKRVNQPFYTKMQRLEKKAVKNLRRSGEELEKARGVEGFVFFDADSYISRKAGRALSTVRTKVYGGGGRRYMAGGRQVVELTNREPHGRIVEKHPFLGHPVATAKEVVRASGAVMVGRAYKKELLARSPMAAPGARVA